MDSSKEQIVPFDELDDFEIAEGDPDVRGWDVMSSDGKKIGEVDNLLIDTGAMKVRYLDVDIDDSLLNDANDNRHILVPIGYARLDEENDQVMVDTLHSGSIMGLPAYTHAPLTREFETEVRQSYDAGYNSQNTGKGYYEHEHFDDNVFGSGRPSTGGTGLTDEALASRRDRAAGEARHIDGRIPERQAASGRTEENRDR